MGAILECLQKAGVQTQENSMTSDAAIIWSVLWNGRMSQNKQVFEHYRAQGKPVIIVEIGALHRGVTWKVSVNHVTAQGYYGHLTDLDFDRPKKLGIELKTQTQSKPNIVLALQHTKSLQVSAIPNMTEWVNTTLSILKNNTDRPITVRQHPRCKIQLPPGVLVEVPKQLVNTYDSFDMQFDCYAVVNYNSGPGIQAAIAGTRPIVDNTSLAYPVSIGFADIEQPYAIDRHLWLAQICHTEYTVEELREGLWLKRIGPALAVK